LLLGPVVGDEVAPSDAEGRRLHLDRAALDRKDGGEPRPLVAPAVAVQVRFGVAVVVALQLVDVDGIDHRPARTAVRGQVEQGSRQRLPPAESLQRTPVAGLDALDGSAPAPYVEHLAITRCVLGTRSSPVLRRHGTSNRLDQRRAQTGQFVVHPILQRAHRGFV
jgi:hypothetical protein